MDWGNGEVVPGSKVRPIDVSLKALEPQAQYYALAYVKVAAFACLPVSRSLSPPSWPLTGLLSCLLDIQKLAQPALRSRALLCRLFSCDLGLAVTLNHCCHVCPEVSSRQ